MGKVKWLTHKGPNKALQKAHKKSIDSVGGVQRRVNQHQEILSYRNVRRTDGDLQRLGTKHVFTAKDSKQWVTVTQVSMQ